MIGIGSDAQPEVGFQLEYLSYGGNSQTAQKYRVFLTGLNPQTRGATPQPGTEVDVEFGAEFKIASGNYLVT